MAWTYEALIRALTNQPSDSRARPDALDPASDVHSLVPPHVDLELAVDLVKVAVKGGFRTGPG